MSVSVAVARGSCGGKTAAAAEEGELDTLLQQLSDARQVMLDLGVEGLLQRLIYPETVLHSNASTWPIR